VQTNQKVLMSQAAEPSPFLLLVC